MFARSLQPALGLLRACNVQIVTQENVYYNLIFKTIPPKLILKRNVQLFNIQEQKSESFLHDSGVNENKAKMKIILEMNFKNPEDALPFYKLPIKSLLNIYRTIKNDEKNNFCKNRLYYMSSRLKCSPAQLRELLVKRTFLYSLSFHWLENSLDVLLEMGVSGERILRDLWVLKYHHETIRERLQKVKDMGIEILYPWMVRCSEDILERYVQISQDTKTILGETKSTQIYLANRLNTTTAAVEEMCLKIPALKTIRVIKVKHFLDFLIQEGFTPEEIVNKPRVLSASQKTIKDRLDKLRGIGVQEINLNILCRSKKHFKKYFEALEQISEESKYDVICRSE